LAAAASSARGRSGHGSALEGGASGAEWHTASSARGHDGHGGNGVARARTARGVHRQREGRRRRARGLMAARAGSAPRQQRRQQQ